MRILCMLPAGQGVYPPEAEERRFNLMRSYTTPSTEIDTIYMPGISGFSPWGGGVGPRPDPQQAQEGAGRAAELAAQAAMKAEQDGYDAFCPFGTLDIGVRLARERGVKMPVVGQAEACFLYCAMLDQPFASCSYVSTNGDDRIRQWAKEAGADHLYVAGTAIGIPNSEYPQRRAEVLENFVRCTKEAKAKGAAIMGLVAMSICPTEYSAKELSDASGFPVLDALGAQIAMAEWWHRTGLPTSLLHMPR